MNSEDSIKEVFKNQPGAIKSIETKGNDRWILAIDVLTRNAEWLPGIDSSGGFFINQNTKIRNLTVTKDTKAYNCGSGPDGNETTADVLQNTPSFISSIQTIISKAKTDLRLVGEFGYTAYFDINGTTITAIYQQCLP